MTRPEGVLVALLCGAALLLDRRGTPIRQILASFGGTFLLIFLPYYLWRFSYYGYPLPNTFYAKVGGTAAQILRGLTYSATALLRQLPLALLALLAIIRQQLARQLPRPAAIVVLCYTGYIIAVGGDHFPYDRFFVPLLPLLALLAADGMRSNSRWLTLALPLLALLASLWQLPTLRDSRTLNTAGQVWTENSVVEKNREIGSWLAQHTPPDTLVATGIAGALPYYAERPIIDMLGLNDLHIAHLEVATIGQGVAGSEKTDDAYILQRRPAYIPAHSTWSLQSRPDFLSSYQLQVLRGPEGRAIRLYRRLAPDSPAGAP